MSYKSEKAYLRAEREITMRDELAEATKPSPRWKLTRRTPARSKENTKLAWPI